MERDAGVLVWRVRRGGAPLVDDPGRRQDPVSAGSTRADKHLSIGIEGYTWRDDTSGRYDAAVHEAATRVEHPLTLLESSLRSERATAAVLCLAIPAVCWAWIVAMARDMYGPMTGPAVG